MNTRPARYWPWCPLPARRYRLADPPSRRPPERSEPAPTPVDAQAWWFDGAWLYGVDLYRHGFLWEAHEAWEGAWRVAPAGPRRRVLRGCIQIAAAALQRERGREAGAGRLVERAVSYLEAAADDDVGELFMGLEVGAVAEASRAWIARPFTPELPPPSLRLTVRSRDRAGCLTDRLVAPPASRHRAIDGALVTETPSRPDFRDGQLLVLDSPPARAALSRWVARARAELPRDVARFSLVWERSAGGDRDAGGEDRAEPLPGPVAPELTGAPSAGDGAPLAVLTLRQAPQLVAPPPGVSVRMASTGADLEALVALSVALFAGRSPGSYRAWARWRYAQLAQRFAHDGGALWGAWRGDVLVGSLGVLARAPLMRLQEVTTRPTERRRGVATSLVTAALGDAFARTHDAWAVAVAEPGGVAERMYRRLGFARHGVQRWSRHGR